MGLPRGRRWVDMPRRLPRTTLERFAEMSRLALVDEPPLENWEELRAEIDRAEAAARRRQGELPLLAPPKDEA